MTTPTITLKQATSTRGLIASGEGSTEFFHPLLPFSFVAANGFLLVLNGWNLNRIVTDTVGYDGSASTSLQLLQMRAPREPITPLISPLGDGRVFRPGAKWRYSWYDSRTGIQSGLSPIPDFEFNMGDLSAVGATTYLGQTAYFYIPTAGKPPHADTIRLWANTTQEDEVWYLADEQPTGAASSILLTDNNTDDELFLQIAVVSGRASLTPDGWSWSTGVMPPMVKAWMHPTNRIFYYGMHRMGRVRISAVRVSVTEASDLVTIESVSARQRIIEPGRVGQRLRLFSAATMNSPIADPTVYRIVKVESSYEFRVWPEIQVSASVAVGATANLYFAIEDDRDTRFTYIAEPGRPWLIDPLRILAAGDDFDDGVLHWFSLGGRVFMQTRRRIYEALGSVSESPALSTIFSPVIDEGSTGFWAGCETPFGWVYLHPTKGVRVFDGSNVSPLGRGADVYGDFTPYTQFQNFEPSLLEDVRISYDGLNRVLIVSYTPLDQGTHKETLCFSAIDRNWRGPYRESVLATGLLRGTDDSDRFVQGDSYGTLVAREEQTLDFVPASPNVMTILGTITTKTTNRIINDNAALYNQDADERLRGAPIWCLHSSAYYFSRIADILSDTSLELESLPVGEDGVQWVPVVGATYGIGSIRWTAITTYIDSNRDPCAPLETFYMRTRFKRGGAVSETFKVDASEDASGTYAGVRVASGSQTPNSIETSANTHGNHRLKRRGAVFQIRFQGIAREGEPQITRAVLIAVEHDTGVLPP